MPRQHEGDERLAFGLPAGAGTTQERAQPGVTLLKHLQKLPKPDR
jgi:hypothetical protein